MYATVRSQPHKVNILFIFFCIRKSSDNLRILQNTIISASTVDFY